MELSGYRYVCRGFLFRHGFSLMGINGFVTQVVFVDQVQDYIILESDPPGKVTHVIHTIQDTGCIAGEQIMAQSRFIIDLTQNKASLFQPRCQKYKDC